MGFWFSWEKITSVHIGSATCDWLRSAVGERKKWSADEETAGTEPERNAAAEPQTEARRSCGPGHALVTRARVA